MYIKLFMHWLEFQAIHLLEPWVFVAMCKANKQSLKLAHWSLAIVHYTLVHTCMVEVYKMMHSSIKMTGDRINHPCTNACELNVVHPLSSVYFPLFMQVVGKIYLQHN